MNRSRESSNCGRIGVGIIGAGGIFADHAKALAALGDDARLIAVADLSQTRLIRATTEHMCPLAFTDHRRLLDRPDIDLIVVATPPSTHEQLAIEALRAGKAVYCEKPLAHTLESADRMIEAADAFPNRLTVGYQLRFSPEVQKAAWLIKNGWLGELVGGTVIRRGRLDGAMRKDETNWWGRWSVAGGGVVMTQFIHELDLLIQLFGTPATTSARLDTLHARIESEDTFHGEITFDSGATVQCTVGVADGGTERHFEIIGKKASLTIPGGLKGIDADVRIRAEKALSAAFPPDPRAPSRHLAARVWRRGLRQLGRKPSRPSIRPTPHVAYYRRVLHAMRTGAPMPVPPADARASLVLCTAIYDSGISGEVVQVPTTCSGRFYQGVSPLDYSSRATTCIC